jgi:aspartyl-tRNA(Asn)/glutamyl-tRNA(Gln) amidotransferase subunit C
LKITDKDVRYVAELANLRLTEDEIARMAHDLDEILSHVDKIDALDTSGVEPMAQVLYDADDTASLREDIEHTPLGSEAATANAPLKGAGFFKVPKVIER